MSRKNGRKNSRPPAGAAHSAAPLPPAPRAAPEQIRLIFCWVAIGLSGLLIILSIIATGALGIVFDSPALRMNILQAESFFNSWPLVVFWCALLLSLLATVTLDRRVLLRPASMAMHFGAVMVLVGSMLSSQLGHDVLGRLTGAGKVRKAAMKIYEEQDSATLYDIKTSKPFASLPFQLRLNDFSVDYYDPQPWSLRARLPQVDAHGHTVDAYQWLDWQEGQPLRIPGTFVDLTVEQYVPNAQPIYANRQRPAIIDAPPDPTSHHPAVRIRLERADGKKAQAWLAPDALSAAVEVPALVGKLPRERMAIIELLPPRGMIRSFNSDISVLEGAGQADRQTIRVNQPLHHRGYHFYQHNYDTIAHRYTVLTVVSDTGLWMVMAGFGLLLAGVFWFFWVKPAIAYFRRQRGA